MAESDADFIRHAGLLAFPRSPQDLTNTAICPACLNPLSSTVCGVCHLDLNHPAAAELFQLSTDAAAALERRAALIGRIRYETEQLIEQQAATRAAALANASPANTIVPPVDPAEPPRVPSRPATPRRSSVQVVLLIVGVSLLSIAAIFFLVFAFISYGLIARSIIIGSITLAALIAASLLKRRGLRATAEGIAVFAVVLVYLDAFAIRANDLAGLESANGAVYWGITLSGTAIAFMLWHRASTLRAPNIAAFTAFVPGIGLLVSGVADSLPGSTQYFAAFMAAGAAGLVHIVGSARATGTGAPAAAATSTGATERIIALSMAGVGLVCAFFAAFAVQPDSVWAPAVALVIVAAVALTHVLVIGNGDAAAGIRVLGAIVAGVGAVAVAAIGVAIATRLDSIETALFWPAVVAVTAALAFEAVARRTANPAMTTPTRVAAFSAAAFAALTLTIPLANALLTTLAAAGSGYASPWSRLATAAAADRGAEPAIAVAALAAAALLAAGFWAGSGLFRRRFAMVLWPAAAAVVLAVPLTGIVWMTVVGWLLLAAIATGVLVFTRERMPIRGSLRLPIAAGGVTALVLGYSASWVSIDSWGWASLATIAILLAGRNALSSAQSAQSTQSVRSVQSAQPERAPRTMILNAAIPRAVLLGAAIVTALVGAAALAGQLRGADSTGWASGIDALRFTAILATLLVAAAAAVPARFASTLDRRVAYWIAAPVALVVTLTSASSLGTAGQPALDALLLPEFGTSLVLGLALLGALLMWAASSRAVSRANAALRAERVVASVAVAPVVYWVVDSFTRVLDLPEYARMTAPMVAALLVAVGSLAATLVRPPTIPAPAVRGLPGSARILPRWVRETSIAVVAVPAVLFAVATGQDAAWLVLILAGVTALVLAIGRDGLFASASPRKHLGWLAILLATAGLWWRLAGEQVSALESYVLPVSVVLLIVAFLIRRAADRAADSARGDRTREESRDSAAPLVALAGLLVSVLPLAVDATTGDPVRAFVIGAVSALLLLGGVFIATGGALRPYLDAAAFTGALGVLVTGAGRGVFLVLESGGSNDARLDLWLGGTFLVLLLAATGIPWAEDADGESRGRRRIAAQLLAVLAMVPVLVLEGASLESDALGSARALTVAVLFSLLCLLGAGWARPPLTPLVGWIGLGFAAAIALIGMAVGALDPIELGTAPIAIALIAGGTLQLVRNPGARSWPHLGPGILILLLPSLIAPAIAPAGEDRPLWRLIGLGVLAVAVLVIGVVRRLQAPFVLGALVALIHGVATFSTEIRIVYQAVPGYYWLAAGGVLLIVLAARYEKRIKNLKDAVLLVTALR